MKKMSKAKGNRNHQNQAEINSEDESNSSIGNLDLSLLRRPIETSITGLEEVFRAYNDGTNELKKLLSKECDLIYECKVCRNMFRQIANFISHKRVYCRSSFNASDHFHFRNNGFVVQDVSTIIQAEQKISNNPNGIAGVLSGNDDKSKDLSGIVEGILWKQHQSRKNNVKEVYDQIHSATSTQEERHDSQKKNQTLVLNPVNDSDIAVFQSFQTDNDDSSIKDEVNEVHNMMKKSNTVLGPDGKIINLFASNNISDEMKLTNNKMEDSLVCQVCNLQFETKKTLKLHLEMKHLPSAYVYQCPSCSQKFSSSAAVLKHLSNDHKKSNRKIRLMRDNIIRKRVRADEAITKSSSTSRELQQLQILTFSDPTKSKNSEDSKLEHGIDTYVCPSCLRKFDRKAVYTSHVQMCSDIKDREQEKLKKRKAKDGAKLKQLLDGSSIESEENSNISEQHPPTNEIESTNKRKRRRNFIKPKVEVEENNKIKTFKEDSEDVVDWNLDDEEEKKKLDNIKKDIIEDEYKRNLEASATIKQEENNESSSQEMHDDDDNGLIIDEKVEGDCGNRLKCPTCNKEFPTNEKLKYHLTFYHSRQKRFKCKLCEYQGYRKKDTMNHINFVHNENVTLATLGNYTETVSKAVNEEDVKIQNELKKNQLKIKRKMARERQRKRIEEAKLQAQKKEEEKKTEDMEDDLSRDEKNILTSPSVFTKTPKSRKSAQQSINPNSSEAHKANAPETVIKFEQKEENLNQNENDDTEDPESPNHLRESQINQFFKSPNTSDITQYGKVVKNAPLIDSSRPIRNRIKPVRKDFLYDLSDLLKKEADAYREQTFQSSNVTVKRELRKRAMSTNTRETPSINSFDQSPTKKSPQDTFSIPAPASPSDEAQASRMKDQKNRRMSVFVPPIRSMFPPQPRSPPYRPPSTHKNAGSAYKMAVKEFDNNCASVYEPKFLWTVCFEQENKSENTSIVPNVSAAASILQRLSGKAPAVDMKPSIGPVATNVLTAEQLCKKFELINVTNINEFDIPDTNAINLNPRSTGNNLMSLALEENDLCVLQECSDDSDDYESGGDSSSKKSKRSSNRKQSEKRKSTTNNQRRLTVMQRLQENKIRKSREQLFQRLISQQNDTVETSSDIELFSES